MVCGYIFIYRIQKRFYLSTKEQISSQSKSTPQECTSKLGLLSASDAVHMIPYKLMLDLALCMFSQI